MSKQQYPSEAKSQPIKRHASIQPYSRDHHHGLLLCWKIRTGLSKPVEPSRIKEYADWFYTNHLLPHFEIEEKYIFPILGNEDKSVKRALSEHRKLKRLFESQNDIVKTLSLIEDDLENHIRFEERILFNQIQQVATPEQLAMIEQQHSVSEFKDNWHDKFWEKTN
ncbi:MAG TPA: hemerythrin domain-containing protein [Cytophagaceae bacterium]